MKNLLITAAVSLAPLISMGSPGGCLIETTDAIADDNGAGSFLYPDGIDKGTADITRFSIKYSQDSWDFKISLKNPDAHTRVGMGIIDETAMASKELDFSIGGTELRLPYWNDHGVFTLLALPDTSLFDFTLEHPLPADQFRPDNSIYVQHEPTLWLNEKGEADEDPNSIYRLEVESIVGENDTTLIFSIDPKVVSPFVNTKSKIYILVYSYLVVPGEFVEYGAMEKTSLLGGTDSWEDSDIFDLAFTADQSSILQDSKLSGLEATNSVSQVGQGLLEVDLTKVCVR